MKNTLGDLNNHLFAQLERLTDEDLNEEEIKTEINRSRAVTGLATQIIQNGALVLRAKVVMENELRDQTNKPKMLEG